MLGVAGTSDARTDRGDTDGSDGSGVNSCESSVIGDATTEALGFRPRFFGITFEGDCALDLSTAGVGSSVASADSVTRVRRRVAAAAFGVDTSSVPAALFGRPRPLPVFKGAGAGVKSSSSSSLISGSGVLFSSSSESSMMGAFLRVAAARVDFRGEIEAMIAMTAG